nr:reverse transcriptase domain-containing protein [Tanacetum cinerariifolium]
MIIENKSKVRNSRNKSIVSQVKSSDGNSSSSSEIAKLTHAFNQQTSVVTTAMTAILKQFQATPPPASIKAVEEIYVTCGGAHPYYQCLAVDDNTFSKFRDNIQGYVSAAAVNYNQGNSDYRPPSVANHIRPLGFAQLNVQNNQNRFSQPQGYNRRNNFNQDSSYQAPIQQNQVVPLSELEKIKNMNEINIKAMQTQINNVKSELRNEMKTSIQALMSNHTNKLKNMMACFFQMNTASTSCSGPLPSNTIANPKGELKSITTRSGIVLDGPSSVVILKKLPKKLGDPRKFLIPCGFSELMYKDLANLGASINLMPLSVWKKLGLPKLISTHMTLELANQEIYTPVRIARDVFVLVGKFTFPADFFLVDYESDPRVPLILGRPFLQTGRALIDVYGEDMIFHDGDERLTLNMRHDTSSYSNQPQKESINMINIYDDSYEDYLEDLFATNRLSGNPTFSSHTDLTSPEVINQLSGSTTSSSPNHLLEEFADELALITLPSRNHDLPFDIESDLREIKYLLNHDPTKDSVDEGNLVDPNDNLFDTIPEMFTDEHTLDYSSLSSSDFLPSPKYDSFLLKDFSEVDALPSTNNEDKVFYPGILIQENLFEFTVQEAPDKNVKKISKSHS